MAGIERGPDGEPGTPAIEARLVRIADDLTDIKAILARIEPMIVRIDAVMQDVATKAQLAELHAGPACGGARGSRTAPLDS